MQQTAFFLDRIEKALRELSFNSNPPELYEPIRYTLGLGGKRMRPVLLLMGNEMFGGDIEKALMPAVGIEVFHNFTLLHDDIMDKAPLRRGKPTVQAKWNSDIAILSGDVMFVKAFQLMMTVDQSIVKRVTGIFSDSAIEVCEGQQMDMNFERSNQLCIADYIRMISLKTAVLLGASVQIGATIGGATGADANHLFNFGKNIGLAFQLQDDLLDVYGSKEKFGKQVGGDILANKKTFLYLKSREILGEPDRKQLDEIYSGKIKLPGEEKIRHVTGFFDKAGARTFAIDEMKHFHNNALSHFEAVKIDYAAKKSLLDFCEELMVRDA